MGENESKIGQCGIDHNPRLNQPIVDSERCRSESSRGTPTGVTVTDHFTPALSGIDEEIVRNVPSGGNWKDLPADFPSKRVRQIQAGSKGGSRSTYYGRLKWDSPAYTVSTYFTRPGNGCFIHPEYDRMITIREAARLQSFPDSVQFCGPLRARCQQIGNAVPPRLGEVAGGALSRA